MRQHHVVVVVALIIGGCAAPAPAVISDISDSSVKVESGIGTTHIDVAVKAREGCRLYDKVPIELSYKCLDQYCFRKESLFACREP